MAIYSQPTTQPPLLRVEILPGIYLISKLPFLYLYNPYKLTQYDHLKPTVKYQLKMSHGAFMISMPQMSHEQRPGF